MIRIAKADGVSERELINQLKAMTFISTLDGYAAVPPGTYTPTLLSPLMR